MVLADLFENGDEWPTEIYQVLRCESSHPMTVFRLIMSKSAIPIPV